MQWIDSLLFSIDLKDNDPDTYKWSTVITVLQSDAFKANTIAQEVIEHLKQKRQCRPYALS